MCVHTAEKIRFYYVMMLELGQGAGGKEGMVVLREVIGVVKM